ncbi:MAG: hypothetical protein SPM31_08820 [Prevotella sp.]|nr:hypothetical protein [Prevotella sp.]
MRKNIRFLLKFSLYLTKGRGCWRAHIIIYKGREKGAPQCIAANTTGGKREENGRETGGEREEDGREERGHEGDWWEKRGHEGNGRKMGGRREATRGTGGRSSLGVPKTEATGEDAVSWQKSGSPTPKRVKRWGGKEKRGEVVLKNLNSNF